jgi:glycerol-3-phosphate acyltransferase PlsY
MDNSYLIIIISLLAGYLFGSISFARIIYKSLRKDETFARIRQRIPGTDRYFDSDSISATAVTLSLGKKYGLLTSLLDMLKVFLPTLIIKHVFDSEPYYLLTAAAAVGGHVYPLYYKFSGGRGESSMIGAFLVINCFGILLCNLFATILGYLFGSILVWRFGWYVISIIWYYIYFKDVYFVLFAICINFFFWFSMRHDLRKFDKLKKKDKLTFTEAEVSAFILMGEGPGRFLDKYGLPALLRKLLKKAL